MQHRIMAMIADRTQALAAVGHDFRTPLARLRLRADSVADPSVASEMEQDIGEMERMIDSLLAYLSGDIDDTTEPVAPTDIAVMCAPPADEASDRGPRVTHAGPDPLVPPVHVTALTTAPLTLHPNPLPSGTHTEERP